MLRRTMTLLAAVAVFAACSNSDPATGPSDNELQAAETSEGRLWRNPSSPPVTVRGTGVHYFTTAAVHGQAPTETGMVQRSTDIVRLEGDMDGYVLYHPTSVFDFAAGTLVNTGTQIFSGTVLDSAPVILHDDRYRFQVDLSTGVTEGQVYLGRSQDAPHRGSWYECNLVISGDGTSTPQGDNVVSYEGTCQKFGR